MEQYNEKLKDKNLIKRLLKYAKPYIGWIGLALFIVIAVVVVDLIRPILIGNAVDDIIMDYGKIYSIKDKETDQTIFIKGFYLAPDSQQGQEEKTVKILHDQSFEDPYFLIIGLDAQERKNIDEPKVYERNQQYYILYEGKEWEVFQLNQAEMKLLRSEDIKDLSLMALVFVGVLLLGLALNYFQALILQYTGQKIIYNIRDELFRHVQSLSIQFFNDNPIGKLVTRITNDTETLNEMYTSVIVNSANSILMILGISIFMFVLDWQLTLAIFLVIPLILVATLIFRKHSIHAYREYRTKIAMVNTFLSEHISGMRIVQIFNQQGRKKKEFGKSNQELLDVHLKQLSIFSIFRNYMYFIYILGLCIVLGFGGYKVIQNSMSIGTLIIFIQYISIFFDPIQQLSEQFDILQSSIASAEKIFQVLDEETQIKDAPDFVELHEVKGEIEFRNVSFAYQSEDWVLKDVSFTVKPGETVAFVGATGAGKTSILNLISRYYDVQKGEIYLDGVPIKKIKLDNLRGHIGQMLQDVFLFTGDIKSNIRLKNAGITDEQIKEASNYVNANVFIDQLPKGYDEPVYERGATFSAGQRQLLSFARTLANNPSILILDEATSNIDTETEELIQDALVKLMKGRTTLVVAHRLSTIQHADKIIVLHKGRIKEMGNHQELLAKKGLYHGLYQLQYRDEEMGAVQYS